MARVYLPVAPEVKMVGLASRVPDVSACTNPLDALTTNSVPLVKAWTSPDEAETTVPLICTRPDDTLTTGMLKPGADDHGLVAAVAVTLIWLLRLTVPLDRLASWPAELVTGPKPAELMIGNRTCVKPADDSTRLPVVLVVTVNWPPLVATTTSGALDRVTVPEERLTAEVNGARVKSCPPDEVTGPMAFEEPTMFTAVDPAPAPAVDMTMRAPANVPLVATVTSAFWVPRMLTEVEPAPPPVVSVTERAPEDVTTGRTPVVETSGAFAMRVIRRSAPGW